MTPEQLLAQIERLFGGETLSEDSDEYKAIAVRPVKLKGEKTDDEHHHQRPPSDIGEYQ